MILKAFCIYDNKVGAFHAPFFVPHEVVAFRSVSALVSDTSTVVGRHPHDHILVEIGSYDDQTGTLQPQLHLNHGPCAQYIAADAQRTLFPLGAHEGTQAMEGNG